MNIVTIVGARPQFIKAAAVSRAIAAQNQGAEVRIAEIIVHTGQHYDASMSEVFFRELSIPEPTYNLGIGSASHGAQTGRMLEKIEEILKKEAPDTVLVYGDTNSTLAGALAAVKLHIPVAHVEAGLRSFNKKMPEEVNRVITDHLSQLLFCPTKHAVSNLANEGIVQGVYNVGDVMYDSILFYRSKLQDKPKVLPRYGLQSGQYVLATVHRAENTDSRDRLSQIFSAFGKIGRRYPVVVALHPRTRKYMESHGISPAAAVHILNPLPYLEMLELESNARLILTDSGGVQKEAFFARVPCLTMREETEWLETVECGANILCGASADRIVAGFDALESLTGAPVWSDQPYGNGDAAGRIVGHLQEMVSISTGAGQC